MKDLIELLKNPSCLGFVALATLGLFYLLKTAIDFWKSTILPIAYQRRLENRKIILPSAKKALDAQWKKSKFFRDGDPKLIDFQDQRIYQRPELETTKSRLKKGRFAHIEGPPSCGKTVLALNIAYEYLLNKRDVFYFTRPSTITDSFFDFLSTPTANKILDRSDVLIIVDDVHLDIALCSKVFSFIFNNYDKCRLLYVSRILQIEYDLDVESWQYNFTKYMPNIEIAADATATPLAKFYSEKKYGRNIPPAILKAFISECGSDLLVLGRYLKEWDGSSSVHLGEIRNRVFQTVQTDLELLRIKSPDAVKVILVLGIFYSFEIPVERSFLEIKCNFYLSPLIKSGEVREQNGFLMLYHSSLAKLYANAIQSLNMQEYAELSNEFTPFPYAFFKTYILSNPRNLCELIVGLRYTRGTIPELLKKSDVRKAIKKSLELERDLSILGWAILVLYVADKDHSWNLIKEADVTTHAEEIASSACSEDMSLFLYNLSKVSLTKGKDWVRGVSCPTMASIIVSMSLRGMVRALIRIKQFSQDYFESLINSMDLSIIVEKILPEERLDILKWSILRLANLLEDRFCVKAYAFPDFLGEWSTRISVYCEKSRIVKFLPGRKLGIPYSQSKEQNRRYLQWLIKRAKSESKIILDDGAVSAICKKNSLFPVGVKGVNGDFDLGDIITIVNGQGEVVGVGVVNYSSIELEQIVAMRSEVISKMTKIAPNRVIDNDLIVAGVRYKQLLDC